MKLQQWAQRHSISDEALKDLLSIFGIVESTINTYPEHFDERNVQADVRLEAGRKGVKLFRNNVGMLFDKRGTPVRFGLANDSAIINDVLKSGDLIGWRKRLITQDMLGSYIAQFVSREVKHPGWKFTGTDRELAQLAWAFLILKDGGDACFCNAEGSL
jgi:hypothetical protein